MAIFKGNDSSLVFSLDTSIHKKQADLVESEFEELRKSRSDRWERMFFRYFSYISPGYYGCLVFTFDEAVLNLSEEEKEKLEETMNSLMMSTDWFTSWASFQSIEQDISSYSKEEIINENLVETYIDGLIDCGYNVSTSGLNDIFGDVLSPDEIDKVTLFHRLKNPQKWNP